MVTADRSNRVCLSHSLSRHDGPRRPPSPDCYSSIHREAKAVNGGGSGIMLGANDDDRSRTQLDSLDRSGYRLSDLLPRRTGADSRGGAEASCRLPGGRPNRRSSHRSDRRAAGRGRRQGWLDCPGYVDLQVNGAFGQDFSAPSVDPSPIATGLLAHGVTAYLPTLVTSPADAYPSLIDGADRASGRGRRASLGLHLEGPFLQANRSGAHPSDFLRLPDDRLFEILTSSGTVRLVTLAPEIPQAPHGGSPVGGLGHSRSHRPLGRHLCRDDGRRRRGEHAWQRTFSIPCDRSTRGSPAWPEQCWWMTESRPASSPMAFTGAPGHAQAGVPGQGRSRHRAGVRRDGCGRDAARPLSSRRAGRRDRRHFRPGCPMARWRAVFSCWIGQWRTWRVGPAPKSAKLCRWRRSARPRRWGSKVERGRNAAGQRADLVVLDHDLRVRATVVSGRLAWGTLARRRGGTN